MSTDENDNDLKALLHETAAGITPHGSLDEIKERAMTTKTNRRWILPTLAAAAAMALVVGGLGYVLRDDDKKAGPGPTDQPSSAVTPTVLDTPLYFVGDAAQGKKLFPETHQISFTDNNPVMAAVEALLEAQPADPDYTNPWSALGAELTGAGLSADPGDGADSIQLSFDNGFPDRPAGMTDAEARQAVEALLFTAKSSAARLSDDVDMVIVVKEEPVDSLLGVPVADAMAANPDEVLAPVQIISPTNGETVKAGKVEVTGVAAAFEANVSWELLVGGDAVVDSGFETAAECCTLSPYSFTLDLEPGMYTLVVHDNDESGEGLPVNQDSKEIMVE